jgi:hypothetical protein
MVFHVSPLDPRAFLGAGFVLTAFGGVAAYLPARRAAGVNPTQRDPVATIVFSGVDSSLPLL